MSVSGAPSPARPAGSSERRPITVVFADLAGSTAAAERMDPEDWTVLVGKAFELMNRTVERFGGTVARLMGDGVLAFFGAPTAHEDDPERAVRCGVEMVTALDQLGAGLRVRVGVNTGPVVVGIVGTDTAQEYTAMGDTVNVAARMQAAARPGSVLVTAATHRFVAPLVDVVDVGLLDLKGKTEPVHAYEITALKRGAVVTRGLAGLRSPLIGRDLELSRLQQAFEVARAGQGRLACIVGEPGMGKSRLLAELRPAVERAQPTVRWVEGRCLSYGETLPYHLVLDLVRSLIGVTAAAEEPQVAEALERFLGETASGDWREIYAYMGHLLSLRLDAEKQARLSMLQMETVKRYVSSLVTMLRGAGTQGPLVVVCDDVHWADPSSVEVLQQIIPSVSGLPVLFILS